MFWNGNPPPNSNTARRHFSTHTCNGCHGRETTTPFLQVHDRAAHNPASLSAFLIGSAPGTLSSPGTETVADPVDGSPNQFGDLLRREQYVGSLLGNSCGAGGLLQGLAPPDVRLRALKLDGESYYGEWTGQSTPIFPPDDGPAYGVTGEGAVFGVLKYPLMLFLLAEKTTTS